ncbi:MAG: cysteine desulfurase family protein [Bacillota bacterium]|nr:cysteine desulfurase family protein [Bacillota bacterium]MDD4708336.1 cysteine desulfurase family protein [Bacillota bacterium]
MREIYFDNAATTRPFEEVVRRMVKCLTVEYGNPSSLHGKGIQAEKILKESRKAVAGALGVGPKEIIFTSGGTESNNTAIRGIARSYSNRGKHIISSRAEHPSVYMTLEDLKNEGFEVTYIDVDGYGVVDLDKLADAMRKDTILVTLMAVNNETGCVQPLEQIGKIVRERNHLTFFHADCIQAFMKIPIDVEKIGTHLVSLSAHKFHGPKGVGAVYCKKGINLRAWQTGGGQELGLRSGTENLPGIAGMGKAVEVFGSHFREHTKKMGILRDRIRRGIGDRIENIRFNTPEGKKGSPHILSVSFRGVRGEVLLHALEKHGIYISTRSACSSKQKQAVGVPEAIGLSSEEEEGMVRISLCPFNTEEEVDILVDALVTEVEALRRLTGR